MPSHGDKIELSNNAADLAEELQTWADVKWDQIDKNVSRCDSEKLAEKVEGTTLLSELQRFAGFVRVSFMNILLSILIIKGRKTKLD
jgi:hypothetical protein